MKAIEKGSIKHLIIQIVSISIWGIILYPLFDYILFKYITKSTFVYSIHDHVIQPIIFGFFTGTVLWIVDRKRK